MGLLKLIFESCSDSVTPMELSVNIDGSPMCGAVDINGNPYGVTDISDSVPSIIDATFNSCSIDDAFSSFDDSFSSFNDSSCGEFDDW